jgi:hypothetical protein
MASPIVTIVATRRKADSRSGASVPKARQAPLNSSTRAIRLRLSGEAIFLRGHNIVMSWEIEFTDSFGDDRWSETNVPKADKVYDVWLEELRKEGLI